MNGSSIRDQLMSVWRQTGKRPEALDNLLELPRSCYLAWRVFLDLNNSRTSNGFGLNPISYQEIWCYCNLKSEFLEEWEVDLIKKFDTAFLRIWAQEREREQQLNSKKK